MQKYYHHPILDPGKQKNFKIMQLRIHGVSKIHSLSSGTNSAYVDK
jgi:hypothetical protein